VLVLLLLDSGLLSDIEVLNFGATNKRIVGDILYSSSIFALLLVFLLSVFESDVVL
jgi:hypothetical protein